MPDKAADSPKEMNEGKQRTDEIRSHLSCKAILIPSHHAPFAHAGDAKAATAPSLCRINVINHTQTSTEAKGVDHEGDLRGRKGRAFAKSVSNPRHHRNSSTEHERGKG